MNNWLRDFLTALVFLACAALAVMVPACLGIAGHPFYAVMALAVIMAAMAATFRS